MKRFVLIAAACVGCGQPVAVPTASPPVFPAMPDAFIPSFLLHDAYATNEAAAKLTYGDKWVMTVGFKGPVEATETGYALKIIESGDCLVLCRFDKSQEVAVASMPTTPSLGRDRVAVIGRVAEVRHNPGYARNTLVILDPCEPRPMPPQWVPQPGKD